MPNVVCEIWYKYPVCVCRILVHANHGVPLNVKLSHDHFATAENWKGQTFMKEVNDPVGKM